MADNLVLVHHGVRGMKWGIRKKRSAGVTAAPKEKTARTPKPKARTMSDEELKRHVNRLQMEKQYKELSAATRPSSKGKKIAEDVLTNSGKAAATTVITAATVYGLKKAIEKQWGTDVVSDIFPKKKK